MDKLSDVFNAAFADEVVKIACATHDGSIVLPVAHMLTAEQCEMLKQAGLWQDIFGADTKPAADMIRKGGIGAANAAGMEHQMAQGRNFGGAAEDPFVAARKQMAEQATAKNVADAAAKAVPAQKPPLRVPPPPTPSHFNITPIR